MVTAAPVHSRPAPRAFTLIELLVVIGIIVLLLAVAFTIGRSVTNSGRMRQTEQTLRVMDTALTEYIQSKEGNPPSWVVDPGFSGNNTKPIIPIIDGVGRRSGNEIEIDSVALFMLQCKNHPQIEAKFRDLDARLVREIEVDFGTSMRRITTVNDGWGNPIRYVHPAFGGLIHPDGQPADFEDLIQSQMLSPPPGHQLAITEVRRGPDDADGGLPQANRPYFYSAGPDGDPATTDDNVYMTKPRFVQAN